MKNIAIYTAIIGNYDTVYQPKVVDADFDYFLFSDTMPEGQNGVWQVKRVSYVNKDKVKIARYVKTHPEEFLPEYNATVWMDANIVIETLDFYQRVKELYNSNIAIASMWHNWWHCVYDELRQVATRGFEDIRKIVLWGNKLHTEKYPRNNGLHETGVTYRIKNSTIKKLDIDWWNFIENFSRRDQFSFDYVLWKNNITCEYFLPIGNNARNTQMLSIEGHSNTEHKIISNFYMEYMKLRHIEDAELKKEFDTIYTSDFPFVRLFMKKCKYTFRIKIIYLVRNIKELIANKRDA